MKSLNKVFGVAITLVMGMTLMACNNSNDNKNNPTDETEPGASGPTTAEVKDFLNNVNISDVSSWEAVSCDYSMKATGKYSGTTVLTQTQDSSYYGAIIDGSSLYWMEDKQTIKESSSSDYQNTYIVVEGGYAYTRVVNNGTTTYWPAEAEADISDGYGTYYEYYLNALILSTVQGAMSESKTAISSSNFTLDEDVSLVETETTKTLDVHFYVSSSYAKTQGVDNTDARYIITTDSNYNLIEINTIYYADVTQSGITVAETMEYDLKKIETSDVVIPSWFDPSEWDS